LKNLIRRLIAAVIFIVSAYFGAGTQSGLYGDISLFLDILIIMGSLFFLSIAVQIWKGKILGSLNDKE